MNVFNNDTYASTSRIVNISYSSVDACISPYSISKRAVEQLTDLFLDTVSLRLFCMLGGY